MFFHWRSGTPPRILGAGAALLILAGAFAAGAEETTVRPAAEFDVAAYHGQVLLVDFWASWCKPCEHSMPWLAELQKQYGAEGLAVVAINIDTDLSKAAAMLAVLPAGVDVYHDKDRKVAAGYDLEGMPSAYLYDRTGKLRGSHVGFLPAEADAREKEIQELLAEGKTE